jgi:hypothetical protein
MRVVLGVIVAALGVVVVLGVTADGQAVEDPIAGAGLGGDLLVESPPGVADVCPASQTRMPARCPAVIPTPNDGWGRARLLDGHPCEYLVDVEPGSSAGSGAGGAIYHFLFGGRCRPFDLAIERGRWPARGFIGRDLRLVGRLPLKPGQSGGFRPDRPRVIRRLRVGSQPGLVLRYRPQPLTTVHTGHLAIVWNEATAGYAASGHPSDPRTGRSERRAIKALRGTAVNMRSGH